MFSRERVHCVMLWFVVYASMLKKKFCAANKGILCMLNFQNWHDSGFTQLVVAIEYSCSLRVGFFVWWLFFFCCFGVFFSCVCVCVCVCLCLLVFVRWCCCLVFLVCLPLSDSFSWKSSQNMQPPLLSPTSWGMN